MTTHIYNLEFPAWCQEITISGYRFTRVEDYAGQLARLQHVSASEAEFKIEATTGQHAITACVDLPDRQDRAVIGWVPRSEPALTDILLLLSLFTGRDVFTAEDDAVILHDPRVYEWGGVLRSALSPSTPRGQESDFGAKVDRVYTKVRDERWQHEFRRGYFLALAQQAFRRQPVEMAFTQCWTVWEHLFEALRNSRFPRYKTSRVPAHQKAVALLEAFAVKGKVDPHTARRVQTLASLRHDLFYTGRFPLVPSRVYHEVVLFIRLTEFLLVKILGL